MTERMTRGFVVTDREPRCPFDPSSRLAEIGRQEEPTRVPMYEPRFGDADVLVLSRYADVRAALGDARLQYGHLPWPTGVRGPTCRASSPTSTARSTPGCGA